MGKVRRFLGSSVVWHAVLSVIPMGLLVVFIAIVNNMKTNEQTIRQENVLTHSGTTIAKSFELFFDLKLAYLRATNNIVTKGIWSDRTNFDEFTRFVLPILESHPNFEAVYVAHDDGTFLLAQRDGHGRTMLLANPIPKEFQRGDDCVTRRHIIPPVTANAVESPEAAWNSWTYLPPDSLTTPGLVNPKAEPRSAEWPTLMISYTFAPQEKKWFLPSQLNEPVPDRNVLSFAARTEIPAQRKSTVKVFSVVRATLRQSVVDAACRRPPSVEFLVVESGSLTIAIDTREGPSNRVGSVLNVSDPIFGFAAQNATLQSSERLRGGFAQTLSGSRTLTGTPLDVTGGQLGDFVLITADTGASITMYANNIALIKASVEMLLSKLPRTVDGALHLVSSQAIEDLSDASETSKLLVSYYFGVSDIVDTLYVCSSDSQVDGIGLIVQPCYQVNLAANPGPNTMAIDVTWWPGNASMVGRSYSASNWEYYPAWPTAPKYYLRPLMTLQHMPEHYGLYPPIYSDIPNDYLEVDRHLSMYTTIAWPVKSHSATKTTSDKSNFLFFFNRDELEHVLFDADVTRNMGAAAVINGDGRVIVSSEDKAISAVTNGPPYFGGVVLSSFQLQFLLSSLNTPQYLSSPTGEGASGDQARTFLKILSVYSARDAIGHSNSSANNNLYLYMIAKEPLGEPLEKTKVDIYTLDILVGVALVLFMFHIGHFIVQIKALADIRHALKRSATLQLTVEEELAIRTHSCYSNYDLDSMQDHAFDICRQIRQHQSLVPQPAREALREGEFGEEGFFSPDVKRKLKLPMQEREICFIRIYSTQVGFFTPGIVRALTNAAKESEGIVMYHRLAPVTYSVSMPSAADGAVALSFYTKQATNECVVGAWKAILRMIPSVRTENSTQPCLITFNCGPALVGNLGPVPADPKAAHYKQFTVSGAVEANSMTLFSAFLEGGHPTTSGAVTVMLDVETSRFLPTNIQSSMQAHRFNVTHNARIYAPGDRTDHHNHEGQQQESRGLMSRGAVSQEDMLPRTGGI